MFRFQSVDGRHATGVLLAVNLLRRRLRDRDVETFHNELEFYAKELKVPAFWLRSLVEESTQPVVF